MCRLIIVCAVFVIMTTGEPVMTSRDPSSGHVIAVEHERVFKKQKPGQTLLEISEIDLVQGRFINSLPEGITLHNVIKTWAEAQKQCVSEGGNIASPIDENIYNAMKFLIDVKNTTFYIGAKAINSPGNFVSLEGIPLENMTVAMINMSPKLDPLDGDCVAMNSDSIRVVPCWTRLPYMCISNAGIETTSPRAEDTKLRMENTNPKTESGNLKTESETPKMNAASNNDHLRTRQQLDHVNDTSIYWCGLDSGVPQGGYKYDASTQKYYKLHREMLAWTAAREVCASEGAHLAVIENTNEAQAIMKMYDFSEASWLHIGILQQTGNGDWKSVNGKPVSHLFNVWRSGRVPTNARLKCGALHRSGVLDDMYCPSKVHFLCQKGAFI